MASRVLRRTMASTSPWSWPRSRLGWNPTTTLKLSSCGGIRDGAMWFSPPRRNLGFSVVSESVAMIFQTAHVWTETPWWLTIVGTTMAFRVVLSPVMIYTMRRSAAIQSAKPKLEQFQAEIKELMSSGQRERAMEEQAKLMAFMRDEGISPWKTMLGPLFQLPVFLSLFFGIRKLVEIEPSLVTGGLAWFVDLTLSDPTYVLPVLTSSSMLAVMELGAESGGSTAVSPMMKNVFRGMCLISIPVTSQFPTAVICYWLTSNVYSVALSGFLRLPMIKRRIRGDPQVTSTMQAPTPTMMKLSPEEAIRTYRKGNDGAQFDPSKLMVGKPKKKRAQHV